MKRILLSLIAVLAIDTAYGQVKATSAELNAGIDDAKFATALALQGSKYLDQSGAKLYAVTAAGANTYTATIAPTITAYSAGQVFFIKITTANTGASTLNLNGLGAKTLVKEAATALANGDLLANRIYAVAYDGTNFQVVDVADALKANLTSPAFTGVPTAPTAAAGTNTTQLATTAFVGSALTANNQTLSLTSLSVGSGYTGDAGSSALYANAGFYPYFNGSGSVNYPTQGGAGFRIVPVATTTGRILEMWASSASDSTIYMRKGIGSGTYSPWMPIVSGGTAKVTNRVIISPTGNTYFQDSGVSESGPGIYLSRTFSTGSTNEHGFIDRTTFGRTSLAYNSYDAQPILTGTTMDHYDSFQARPNIQNVIDEIRGHSFIPRLNVGGQVNNMYAFKVYAPTGTTSANVAHNYGVYIPSMGSGTVDKLAMWVQSDSLHLGGMVNTFGGIDARNGSGIFVGGLGAISNESTSLGINKTSTLRDIKFYSGADGGTPKMTLANGGTIVSRPQVANDNLKLEYDGSNSTGLKTSATGNLTITPTGGQTNIIGSLASGNLYISNVPPTSVSGYTLLTRDNTSGQVGKVSATGLGASDLALGTATATTQPITNSNGTGVILPAATGSLAGLQSAADKTKLDAITGTNTGDQSLSTTGVAGNITISAGNAIGLTSLQRATTGFEDANTIPNTGFYAASTSSSATNYAAGGLSGMGIHVVRNSGDALGSFSFWKPTTGSDALYFRSGTGATGVFSAWDIIAGRTWVGAQLGSYLPLAGGSLTGSLTIGGTLGIAGILTGTVGQFTTRLNVGALTATNVNFYNSKDIAGGANSYSNFTNAIVQPDVTTVAYGHRINLGTAASSFTLPNLYYNYATQGTFGAGSSVTNQFGYYADNSIAGASTLNVGYGSNIAAGAGRWNLYVTGTAQNYFAGNVGIGTTSPGASLQVTATADATKGVVVRGFSATQSANLLEVQNSAGTAQTVVDNTGNLGINAGANLYHVIGAEQQTIYNPAHYYSTAATTGAIVFKHATLSAATMFDIKLKFYRYNTNTALGELRISFYKPDAILINSTTGKYAYTIGNPPVELDQVRVGFDGSGNLSIILSDVTTAWNTHNRVIVTEMTTSYTGGTNSVWRNGWTSAVETDLSAYTSLTALPITNMSLNGFIQNSALGQTADLRITGVGLFGGRVTAGTISNLGQLTVVPAADVAKGQVTRAFSPSQSANLQEWQTSTGSLQSSITAGGAFNSINPYYGIGTANASSSSNSYVRTLATGTVIQSNKANADNVLTVNNINTSSSGLILDGQAAGVTVASIDKTGLGTFSGLNLATAPTTSAGTYDVLTRNTTTGAIEKTGSSVFTAAAANVVYAGPLAGTANPTFRKLQRSDIEEAFGASGTAGVLDWDDVSNTQPGSGPVLLLGTAANGFGSSRYFHPFTFEYSSKNGTGNLTQMAYPYNPTAAEGIQYRTRSSGVFSAWRKVWDSSNFTNLSQLTTRNFSDLQNRPTTLTGYGITDGATSASVTAVQSSVTTLDNNAVHKAGTETIAGTKFFNGGVGIGLIAATVPSAYKLAVGGGIIAESVKVKPQGEWPDYVFEKGYPILSLRELEAFILKNKHLPDVPAATEIKKDGLDLGEMDSKLLKKIEELTLYLIDLKKENETLKERLDKLEKK